MNPDTRNLEALVAKAVDIHRAGRFGEAIAAYNEVLAQSPLHAGALHNLGVIAATQGDHRLAVERFDAALAAAPGYILAHLHRAQSKQALGDLPEAASGFERVCHLDSSHYGAHRALGFLWLAMGNRGRSLDHFARTYDLRRGEDRTAIARQSLTHATRDKFKEFRITSEDEKGFRLGKLGIYEDGSVGPVEGEVEFALPNLVRLDIADGTKSGLYRVVIMPTPINERSTCAFYVRTRHTEGAWSRFKWQLWWTLHGRSVHGVAAQDRDILTGLGPVQEARQLEHLALSDTGIVRLRRRLQQAYNANEN